MIFAPPHPTPPHLPRPPKCTLTLDCVECVLQGNRLHSIHSNVTVPRRRRRCVAHPPPPRVAFSYCSSHIGVSPMSIQIGRLRNSGFQKALICTLYLNISQLSTFSSILGWYVSNTTSSVHMALFALAGQTSLFLAFSEETLGPGLGDGFRWGPKVGEVWSTDCSELSLDLKPVLVSCFQGGGGREGGGQMCALEVCCLTKTSLS